MNRHFSKEIHMAKKCMKTWIPLLAIKEIQIKAITFTSAFVKKARNNKYCWWECKLLQPLQKKV